MTESQAHTLLIYSGIQTVAILIGFIGLGIMGFAIARLIKVVTELTAEAKGKVYPILENVHHISDKVADISTTARDLTADAAPKIKRVTQNIAETSDVYRARLAEVDALVQDTAEKARRQTDRVDAAVTSAVQRTHGIVDTTLERTQHVVDSLHRAIYAPVRQVSSLFSGAKAGIETLIENFTPKHEKKTPRPTAFEGESIYTGLEDDYHA